MVNTKYTEYSFEQFDRHSGINKVQKWIDGPSVDYIDYSVNKNKNYRLSYYDIKSLVFNFISNNDKDRIIDIIKNISNINNSYLWECLLEYNINSNSKTVIIELIQFLIDNGFYPTIGQTVSLILLNCEELNSILRLTERNFNFGEPNFYEYSKIIYSLNDDQLSLLVFLGFNKKEDWDITLKTLKENNIDRELRSYKYNRYSLFDDILHRQLVNPLYLI